MKPRRRHYHRLAVCDQGAPFRDDPGEGMRQRLMPAIDDCFEATRPRGCSWPVSSHGANSCRSEFTLSRLAPSPCATSKLQRRATKSSVISHCTLSAHDWPESRASASKSCRSMMGAAQNRCDRLFIQWHCGRNRRSNICLNDPVTVARATTVKRGQSSCVSLSDCIDRTSTMIGACAAQSNSLQRVHALYGPRISRAAFHLTGHRPYPEAALLMACGQAAG
jgi:hypothetical protein